MAHMATKSLGDEFYYIEAILGRCGVPIFFMISGYFAARHVKKDPENSGRWFLKNALRMIWQFVIFSVIIFAFYRLGNLLFQMEDMTFTIDKDHISGYWYSTTLCLAEFCGICLPMPTVC